MIPRIQRICYGLLWAISWALNLYIVHAAGMDSPKTGLRTLHRVASVDCVRFGSLEAWEGFDFGPILPRHVSVWLPPAPYWDGKRPLPVWYFHDGQNLWDPRRGYGGQSWNLDSLMEHALSRGLIEPCLIVSLDNSPQRFRDYLPPPCLDGLDKACRDTLQKERPGTALGRAYADWIADVLQTWLTMQYPVDTHPASHYLMGASMGGLISSYTAALRPDRFGGAACLSTHWPLSLQRNRLEMSLPYRTWLTERLSGSLDHGKTLHSIYMDHGDQTLDAFYPVHQRAFDSTLRKRGLPTGFRYRSEAIAGAAHTEKDWSQRCLEAMIWVMKGRTTTTVPLSPPPPSRWCMYFALIDRLEDGDSTNNQRIPSTYNPQRPHYHHGGDLEGLRKKIPYLKSLGINSLWITPPVLNQNFNPDSSLTGYHGYWASDFRRLDPRWGTPKEFKRLGQDLEKNGIALIQDVVVNHAGDYFEVLANGDLKIHNEGRPQQGFLRDFPSPKAGRTSYHRLPNIVDYKDSLQRLQGQMSGLDDLRTENPAVRRHLRRAYQKWVKKGRLRGMRMDTPLYVESDFWEDFLHRKSIFNPGMHQVARRRGQDLWTFGELWTHSEAWSDQGEKEAASYTLPGLGMEAALQFPLQKTLMEVLGGTRGTAHLSYRLEAQQRHFPNPLTRIQFLDNHDMPRLRSRLDSVRSAQALVLLYTLPGIPVLYYGTEIGTPETRASVLGEDLEKGSLAPLIRQLTAFRQRFPHLQTTEPVVLLDSRLGSSAWVALVGGQWLLAMNPGTRAAPVSDSMVLASLGSGWSLLEKPTIQCGGTAQRKAQGWILEPGEVWVWGLIPPPGNPPGINSLKAAYPLPQNLAPWLQEAEVRAAALDPVGDDRGSNGELSYPEAFGKLRPGDLTGLRWLHSASGGYILEIQIKDSLSQVWNPPHGLDHVSLDIQFEGILDDRKVTTRFELNGWTASGSQPWEWYTQPQKGTIYAVFGPHHPLAKGGDFVLSEFQSMTIRVQTWDVDGDGQPRHVRPTPGAYEFGGDPETEKWMDRALLVVEKK